MFDICLTEVYIMVWKVLLSKKAAKQNKALGLPIQAVFALLLKEIELLGPFRVNWKNYGKLTKTKFHCHLKKGNPTYVACWQIMDKKIKITEVYYVGTHENAPY